MAEQGRAEFEKVMFRASADPAQFTPRGDDYEEPVYQWQVRAILLALRALPVEQRMEAMGMEPTEVLAALGGVYNGKSTEPLHWWRLPIEGSFDA